MIPSIYQRNARKECIKNHYIEILFLMISPRTLSEKSDPQKIPQKPRPKNKSRYKRNQKIIQTRTYNNTPESRRLYWDTHPLSAMPYEIFRALLPFLKTENRCQGLLTEYDKYSYKIRQNNDLCPLHKSILYKKSEELYLEYIKKENMKIRIKNWLEKKSVPVLEPGYIEKKSYKTSKNHSKSIRKERFGFSIYSESCRIKEPRHNSRIVIKQSKNKSNRCHERQYYSRFNDPIINEINGELLDDEWTFDWYRIYYCNCNYCRDR